MDLHTPHHLGAAALPEGLLGPRRVLDFTYNRRFVGEVKVAPRGYSGKFCFSCQRYLTLAESDAFGNEMVHCGYCNAEQYWAELSVDLREDQLALLNDAEVLDRSWYHASQSANWHAGVQASGCFVHLGSREAALERLGHLRLMPGESGSGGAVHHLHEVRLKPHSKIAPGIYHDQINHWPASREQLVGKSGVSMAGFDVLRYMNEYEAAGSVSLLLDPSGFVLVQSEEVVST